MCACVIINFDRRTALGRYYVICSQTDVVVCLSAMTTTMMGSIDRFRESGCTVRRKIRCLYTGILHAKPVLFTRIIYFFFLLLLLLLRRAATTSIILGYFSARVYSSVSRFASRARDRSQLSLSVSLIRTRSFLRYPSSSLARHRRVSRRRITNSSMTSKRVLLTFFLIFFFLHTYYNVYST